MKTRTSMVLVTLAALSSVCTPEPVPEHFSFSSAKQQRQDSTSSGTQTWQQTLKNSSDSKANYLDPLSVSLADEIPKNDVPRQLYGPPPLPNTGSQQFPTTGFQQVPNSGYQPNSNTGFQQDANSGFQQFPSSFYPQIYRLDNLVIIANPPQNQPQPCIPQRPPPNFPSPIRPGETDDGLSNRLGGDEPTKCTWAIVACCSPDNNNVRYNCFELLGCPGFFFDTNPCDPELVMIAANAALNYYSKSATNSSSEATNTNRV